MASGLSTRIDRRGGRCRQATPMTNVKTTVASATNIATVPVLVGPK